MLPSVGDFFAQNPAIFFIKLMDLVNVMRALCYQSALDEVWFKFGDVVLGSELLNILKQLLLWDTDEGILDFSSNVFSQCCHTFFAAAQVGEDGSFALFIVGDFTGGFDWEILWSPVSTLSDLWGAWFSHPAVSIGFNSIPFSQSEVNERIIIFFGPEPGLFIR